jgi:hypothetical protein
MAFRTRFTRSILSTLVVTGALFIGSQPATAQASDPDPVLMAGLEAIAAEFGDSVGHILALDPAGAPMVLARYLRGFGFIYTAGDSVSQDDTLAFCYQNPFGGLSSCEVLAAPDPTAYECDWDNEWSWCTCDGVYDCIDMLREGPCDDEEWACNDGICVCSA